VDAGVSSAGVSSVCREAVVLGVSSSGMGEIESFSWHKPGGDDLHLTADLKLGLEISPVLAALASEATSSLLAAAAPNSVLGSGNAGVLADLQCGVRALHLFAGLPWGSAGSVDPPQSLRKDA